VAAAIGLALWGLAGDGGHEAGCRTPPAARPAPAARIADNPGRDVILANPRGLCAGVARAIEIVKRAIETRGAPIYVRHEVVHNRFVVDDLKQRGAIFVEELDEVPDGNTEIFSAHGVSKAVRRSEEHTSELQSREKTVCG